MVNDKALGQSEPTIWRLRKRLSQSSICTVITEAMLGKEIWESKDCRRAGGQLGGLVCSHAGKAGG